MIQMALRPFRFWTRSSGTDAEVAGGRQLRHGIGAEVEADHLVAAQTQTLRHVAAHLAKADQS